MNAYEEDGTLIGRITAGFVFNPQGKRIYRIEDGEIYCWLVEREGGSLSRLSSAEIKCGNLEDGIAIGLDGRILFIIQGTMEIRKGEKA